VIVLTSLLVVSMLSSPATADPAWRTFPAPGERIYRGETTGGGTVHFRVRKTETGREIRGFFLATLLECSDGTTKRERKLLTDWGWTFEGRTAIVDENRPFDWGLRIVGRFRPASATGTLQFTWSMLQDDHTALLCTTGEVEWTAERFYP